MPYLSLTNAATIIPRPASLSANGAGPYYFCMLLDDTGAAVVVNFGGVNYYIGFWTTDHGGNADATTGVYMYLIVVGNNVLNPANWLRCNDVAATGLTNPILSNNPPNNQPETVCVRKVGSIYVMSLHEDQGSGIQRTVYYTSPDLLVWTRQGNFFPDATSDIIDFVHDGYAQWSRNLWFPGLGGQYFAVSLAAKVGSGSGEQGTFHHCRILSGNAPGSGAAGWNHVRYESQGHRPGIFPAITQGHRPLRIESAMTGFERLSDGNFVGLISTVQAESGADARLSELGEMVYDENFEMVVQPTMGLLAKSGDHANEQGQPFVAVLNGQKYCFFQGASASNVNSVVAAELSFNASAAPPDTHPQRVARKVTDFTTLSALPSDMAKHANGTATFSPSTGLTLAAPAGTNQETLLRLGAAFTPRDWWLVDLLFEGFTNSNGSITCTIGFTTSSESSVTNFGNASSQNVQAFQVTNGAAKLGERVSASTNTWSTYDSGIMAAGEAHGWGRDNNTGANRPKVVGLRWWPHLNQIAWLDEHGESAWLQALTLTTHTLTTAHIPAIAVLSATGATSATFRKVTVNKVAVSQYRVPTQRMKPLVGSSRLLRV